MQTPGIRSVPQWQPVRWTGVRPASGEPGLPADQVSLASWDTVSLQVPPAVLADAQKRLALDTALKLLNAAGIPTSVNQTAAASLPTRVSAPLPEFARSLAGLAGVQDVRMDGVQVVVTPADSYAGRAVASLLKDRVQGYPVLVLQGEREASDDETLVYLRNLPGVDPERELSVGDARGASRPHLGVEVSDEALRQFYGKVLGNDRLPFTLNFQVPRADYVTSYWAEQSPTYSPAPHWKD
ncbi:MAG: hypothetical protein AB1758_02485 [Candidatus Eremiobacterota bacterium]